MGYLIWREHCQTMCAGYVRLGRRWKGSTSRGVELVSTRLVNFSRDEREKSLYESIIQYNVERRAI
jgi:hypothetical protein